MNRGSGNGQSKSKSGSHFNNSFGLVNQTSLLTW
jgi:hypothetical protein